MADFSGTIGRLGGQALTVTRDLASGSYVDGRFVPSGIIDLIPITGSVQPLDDKDVQRLTDGQRTRAKWKLYTVTPLIVSEKPDTLVYDSVEYEVSAVADWKPQGGYFRYVLLKMEVVAAS